MTFSGHTTALKFSNSYGCCRVGTQNTPKLVQIPYFIELSNVDVTGA